ncbi:MAG: sugar ABC transporter substrate-binding protein [Chloroflexota bacterium]|nr:sugar ABC transporter substrate-binding protein [Chloroflexota bacterium]
MSIKSENSRGQPLSRRAMLRGMMALGAASIGTNLLAGCVAPVAPAEPAAPAAADAGPDPKTFQPFQPSDTVGEIPDLPRRIAWANTSNAEFFLAITNSIQMAAEDRDLEFITAIANDDSAKNIEQINTFLQRGIAALCIQPLDANAQAPLMQQAIDEGIAVLSLVTPPSTSQVVADQYKVGNTQGLAAAKWITENLGGQAKVHYFNIDTIEVLIARHQGVLDGVKTAGEGVEIVSDVNAGAITNEAGFNTMNTVLQAHPDINVILGGDTLVLGALAAIEAAGKASENIYISGIDGDSEALNKIRAGGAYKASFAFAYPMMGYAWGQYAADWVEGKSIPQVQQFNAIELSSPETIDAFEAAMANVRETWKSADTYFTNLGSISYATRDQYVRVAA